MRILSGFFFLLLFASCGVRLPEGRAKPVYFEADELVFADSLDPRPMLMYHKPHWLYSPCTDIVYLERGKKVKALVVGPTIFWMNQYSFLVNPKDRIRVSTDPSKDFTPSLSTLNNKSRRDRELQVLKHFEQLEKEPKITRLLEYDYKMIQELEFSLKAQVHPAEKAAKQLFDSLSRAYQVSRKFKRSTRDYTKNLYNKTLLNLYWQYRDTLFARKVYYDKVKEGLVLASNSAPRNRLNGNMETFINLLNTSIYPSMGISAMVYQGRFDECFTTLSTVFTGSARDLLLSRLMYNAAVLGFTVPPNYEELYRNYSINPAYRKIVKGYRRSSDTVQIIRPILPNDLLLPDGKTVSSWDSVLANNKGKYVLIDFWASWCTPCLEDLPELERLKKQFPAEKISFLSMSLDTDKDQWKSRLIKLNSNPSTNFLFVHPGNAAILQSMKINEIPRYLLIDPAGKIINDYLPGPRDPELKRLLEQIIE
ncbi:TlpA family protein disulfide reductase [Flavihumibacter sp. UBA7668]|uniref:TlpA family protein disulfide reductase n=1 Tax=Flavihumibacter sp. UBA7668 TaxID=1946542 RepID=UPI0025C0CD49|nr:TlpA disulfide reductase family protein [Flavihumibacter sp. UBA7668]